MIDPDIQQKSLEDLEGIIWLNGEFINWNEAKIHLLTYSLHYSVSVFEGEKAINGKVFQIEKHTDRLFASAKSLYMEIPYSKEEIIKVTDELLIRNNIKNGYIRPLVFLSTDNLILKPNNPKTNVMIATWNVRKPVTNDNLKICLVSIRPSTVYNTNCKATSFYANMSILVRKVNQKAFDDGLMLDDNGYINECTTSNIFFYKDNILYTPKKDKILNGVTRQSVIWIARNNNIDIIEKDINLDEILSFDGAFITGTAAGIKIIGEISVDNSMFDPSKYFERYKNIFKINEFDRSNHINSGNDESVVTLENDVLSVKYSNFSLAKFIKNNYEKLLNNQVKL